MAGNESLNKAEAHLLLFSGGLSNDDNDELVNKSDHISAFNFLLFALLGCVFKMKVKKISALLGRRGRALSFTTDNFKYKHPNV